jgi:DNA-binding transcriptional regulator YiaG
MEREYCKKCSKCRERAVVIATIPQEMDMTHDGRTYRVSIPDLTVPQCTKCGNFSFDYEADVQIDRAFRRHAGLLQPEQIRQQREALGLQPEDVATALDISLEVYRDWEIGHLIPMRSQDRFLRAFFRLPELRAFLMNKDGESAKQAVA